MTLLEVGTWLGESWAKFSIEKLALCARMMHQMHPLCVRCTESLVQHTPDPHTVHWARPVWCVRCAPGACRATPDARRPSFCLSPVSTERVRCPRGGRIKPEGREFVRSVSPSSPAISQNQSLTLVATHHHGAEDCLLSSVLCDLQAIRLSP